uniref:DXP reductoisomerase C-terminal domain-containing protein n=1 Tax=Conchiformibius kuhniae TaxID=211502 RepID=A0A8T9MX18_9NEIS|nr:hypothetical protein LVJ77_08110 [Conchiformibius kuhniae]
MTFHQPDFARFPCLKLAYDAMHAGGFAPCVLNAANEAAVAAFLRGQIRFTDIARTVAHALEHVPAGEPESIAALVSADTETRARAEAFFQAA